MPAVFAEDRTGKGDVSKMQLKINGETREVAAQTLFELIHQFGLNERLVVAEVDGEIIDRSEWEETRLTEGMCIELVQFVGGG
jgi:sulfur carrier protein